MSSQREAMEILIVDDESLARRGIRNLLKTYSNISKIEEASSLSEAKDALTRFTPSIVFLDIRLFGDSGFELIPHLPISSSVIFVTAFDNYAIRAFEVNALDYLLKPIDSNRFHAAMERAINGKAHIGDGPATDSITSDDIISIKDGKKNYFVRIKDIGAITASSEYTEVLTSRLHPLLIRKSLKDWEKFLPTAHFVRIHRQSIVNLDYIEKLEPLSNNRLAVHLSSGFPTLEASNRLTPTLRSKLRDKETT